MRLLRVELGRFRSRRAIVLILVAAALLTVLITAAEIWNSRPVTAEEAKHDHDSTLVSRSPPRRLPGRN